MAFLDPLKEKFYSQKHTATTRRGIDWQFTYAEWLAWWGDDIHLRGRGKGKLVMARRGDTGPYSPDNCIKLLMEDNIRDGNQGRKHSAETCAKKSKALRGKKRSAETLEKISKIHKGKKLSLEAIAQREATRKARQAQARDAGELYGYDLRDYNRKLKSQK